MDQYKAYFHHTELGSSTGMFVFPNLTTRYPFIQRMLTIEVASL